jgi:hypothetical protein
MALDFWKKREIEREIDATQAEIMLALWQMPADIDRAKTLISKRTGLRIVLGEIQVKLKPPTESAALLAA